MNKRDVLALCTPSSRYSHSDALTPMYEAKMIHQFDHRFGTYQGQTSAQANQGKLPELDANQHADPHFRVLPKYWIHPEEVTNRIRGLWNRPWLLGWRDITSAVTVRTVIACILPVVGTDFTIRVGFLNFPVRSAPLLLLANFNSFVFDYCARQMLSGSHLSDYIMKQLPVLPPSAYEGTCPWSPMEDVATWITSRALELTYTSWDLKPFAEDMGYKGAPFSWNEDRRLLLRSELDAALFHLYGIRRDDADYIMETYWIVKQKDQARHGEYRTKRLCLEAYDR